jgi:hypothetical protein
VRNLLRCPRVWARDHRRDKAGRRRWEIRDGMTTEQEVELRRRWLDETDGSDRE